MSDVKFRYSLDFGAGYVLVNTHNNTLKLNVTKSPNKAFKIQEISGGISFVGQTAKDAYDKRTSRYFVPLKIEEYNGAIWQILHETNIDVVTGAEYQQQSRVLKVTKFSEISTPESTILANLTNTYRTNNVSFLAISPVQNTYTSTQFQIAGVPTALDKDAYKLNYDIEGNVTIVLDPRWAYFAWDSTVGISPNLQHLYSTRSFLSKPQLNSTTNGYDQINFFLVTYWVKLPPVFPYTDESWNDFILTNAYKVSNVLKWVINGLDNTLTFDYTDDGEFVIDSFNNYLGDGNEYEPADIEGINFNLALLFNYFENYFNNSWYMDGVKLKFRANAYKYFNSTLDWSSETANINELKPITGIPDLEMWRFGDDSMDRMLLSYFDKNVPTNQNIKDYSIDIMHNIPVLRNGGISRGKLVWLNNSGGTININTPATLFESYGKFRGFSEFAPQSVSTDPDDAYTAIIGSENRPIYELEHNKWVNDYFAFDLFSKITVSGANVGYLDSYVIDLKTGEANFKILFDTFTL